MKLTATKLLKRYGGKNIASGEVFEAKVSDVRILMALNRATAYVEPPKKVPAVFKPIAAVEAMRANESITDAQAEQVYEHHATHVITEEKPKRAYKRRDMTAE
jgi:hypothetical protein